MSTSSSLFSDVLHSGTTPSLVSVNMINVTKLNTTNYITWSTQLRSLLKGYDLLRFIDASARIPPPTITSHGDDIPNPDYTLWIRQDSLLFSSIMGSIELPHQPLIASATTSLEAWTTLAQTYAKPSRGHIKQLKSQLKHYVKGSQSIDTYMQVIKTNSDALAMLGHPYDQEDLTDLVLDGLPEDYKPIVEAIHGRETMISFSELHEKLITRELALTVSPSAQASFPITANHAQQRTSQWRGHNNNSPRSGPSHNQHRHPGPTNTGKPYLGRCQAYGTQGHSAKRCPNFKIVSLSDNQSPAQRLYHAYNAAMAAYDNNSWLLDSGASHHLTSDLANLSLHAPYVGSDNVQVGNGSNLAISNTGSSTLPSSSHTFSLKNVLHVPRIARNLISVNKLCSDNNVSVEFFPHWFQVKDLSSETPVVTGTARNGGYEWPHQHQPSSSSFYAYSNVAKSPLLIWHSRLGHPTLSALKAAISPLVLSSTSRLFSCSDCLSNKMSKQPFSITSSFVSSKPLELVYSDVWTSPLVSIDGFKYYVIFVDHYTHYIWLYHLKQKSDVKDTFIQWKALVENRFQQRLINFYSDNGGEFLVLREYLATHGVSHLTTPPHTPEHNGFSERRHRHIVETGLTQLSHAGMPLTYWTYALLTAVYLINRMPTSSLSNAAPFTLLFGASPNYSKLKVFGCLCFPWLKPYTDHKLEPKSQPCVFLGYSLTQSAYLCLQPSTTRIFVSRHVRFVETEFPFHKLSLPSVNTKSSLSNWCPPVTTVAVPSLIPPAQASSPSTPESSGLLSSPVNTLHNSLHLDSVPAAPSLAASPEPALVAPTMGVAPFPAAQNAHPMQTRAKSRIHKPKAKVSFVARTLSQSEDEPKKVAQALTDRRWRNSMSTEFDSQLLHRTWDLIPPSPHYNLIGNKWVFRLKRNPDGSVNKFKARLVAKGFHQRPGIDFTATFSPVVKQATILIILGVAVSRDWPIQQLDLNNAFLQGHLTDDVYMAQPVGFVDKDKPDYVCKLRKALYGLKQAPRAWYLELKTFLIAAGFVNSLADASLFIFNSNATLIYVLVYVDDIIVTGNAPQRVQEFIASLSKRFSLKDLDELNYFLGVEATRSSAGLLLNQRKYVTDLLHKTKMLHAKPASSPMVSTDRLQLTSGTPLADGSEYRQVVGSLQYLHFTRPDIAFAVNKLSQFMHKPTDIHWLAVKRLLRYLSGTKDRGIFLKRQNVESLHAFSDADWGGNRDDYTSTGAYIVYLGSNPVSWFSKKQKSVARSSTEAEYRAVADTASELRWTLSLLQELGLKSKTQPVIYCDNIGATYLSANPVFHSRMKHVAIAYHFIRELVQTSVLCVAHVSSKDQLVDALTKPVTRALLEAYSDKIGLSTGRPSCGGV